ncbi:MAG: ComEA family DNA-binding protein [Longimicrobiales bacterium]
MEERGLFRGAVFLLFLALARMAVAGFGGSPVVSGPAGDRLPELLESAEEARVAEERSARPLAVGETLYPNRAGSEDLVRLPGIGPSLADAMARHREAEGGFHDPDDLLDVTGIGPATLDRIRPFLDFSAGVPLDLRKVRRASPAVNLNRAGREELESLPGIGPALAGRILESRSREGPFRSLEDLTRVPGIGPATVERLQGLAQAGR